MQPDDIDAGYLWDMIEAGRAVQRFVASLDREGYLSDEVVQAAVERKIEIIGEAARKLSIPFQQAHPEIPWAKIAAQRHVLAHDYGRIEHDRIWEVATVHVPTLVAQLAQLLPREADGA
jgi:uncharacterized protein with HEPN domain